MISKNKKLFLKIYIPFVIIISVALIILTKEDIKNLSLESHNIKNYSEVGVFEVGRTFEYNKNSTTIRRYEFDIFGEKLSSKTVLEPNKVSIEYTGRNRDKLSKHTIIKPNGEILSFEKASSRVINAHANSITSSLK